MPLYTSKEPFFYTVPKGHDEYSVLVVRRPFCPAEHSGRTPSFRSFAWRQKKKEEPLSNTFAPNKNNHKIITSLKGTIRKTFRRFKNLDIFEQTFAHLKYSSTINDVSRESNVSVTTVSRVLNGLSKKYRISEETEELVLKAAQKLNYRPNLNAVNLRLRKSNTIGLVVPSLANPFFANMASLITVELQWKGYSVMVTDCGEDEKQEAALISLLADRRIDGILISPSGTGFDHLESVYNRGVPVVCLDRYFEDAVIPYVSTNNFQGAYDMTNFLIRAGHRHIACIAGTRNVAPVLQRSRGYRTAMEEAGLKADVTGNGFTVQDGYIETKMLLSRTNKPTAIFAFSDPIALGSLKALKEEGLSVPDDLSLVTFDDAEYLNFLNPPVTSVVQPMADMTRIAIKMLLERIEQGENGVLNRQERILLQPRIIHRKSVQAL